MINNGYDVLRESRDSLVSQQLRRYLLNLRRETDRKQSRSLFSTTNLGLMTAGAAIGAALGLPFLAGGPVLALAAATAVSGLFTISKKAEHEAIKTVSTKVGHRTLKSHVERTNRRAVRLEKQHRRHFNIGMAVMVTMAVCHHIPGLREAVSHVFTSTMVMDAGLLAYAVPSMLRFNRIAAVTGRILKEKKHQLKAASIHADGLVRERNRKAAMSQVKKKELPPLTKSQKLGIAFRRAMDMPTIGDIARRKYEQEQKQIQRRLQR